MGDAMVGKLMAKGAGLAMLGCVMVGNAVAQAKPAPGGLYLGYYQEDPLANPEDPTPGAFVLRLPDKDEAFAGAMYFTFVGCQTSNVGKVEGKKAGQKLAGNWSGTVDGSAQSGAYEGWYSAATGAYKGTYSNAGGKQYRDISGCIQYYIGPKGSWEMFSAERSYPESFQINVTGNTVSLPSQPGVLMTLVYVVDESLAKNAGANPIVYQTAVPGAAKTVKLDKARLKPGTEYLVVALVNNAKVQRAGFTSKRFIAK